MNAKPLPSCTCPLTVANAGTPIGRVVFISVNEIYPIVLETGWTAAEVMLTSVWRDASRYRDISPVPSIDPSERVLYVDFRKRAKEQKSVNKPALA